MKKIAHCIHHTHWDLIWYFTVQDATVQFAYNMKELLRGFKTGRVQDFFMDGQTAPIDEYLYLHPEDKEYIEELIQAGKLIIGPFNSQLDCFICSGESVINNLRLGIKTSKKLGKVSKVAYLPDSFGHSYDFPKIFNEFGIKDFVITRGVGDDYGLDSEFYLESNDGSKILVCTMIAGYGYGCYAFKEGTLFEDSALDYNKISVRSLIDRLLKYSTIKDEFVFPLGFDQNPAMMDIENRIQKYNESNDEIKFKSTTWQDFCNHVRVNGENLKTRKGEILSTQYHRIHRSIFSGRSDIKALQDECERELTYQLQPMCSILDSLGIEYDHGLIDSCWEKLVKCQTHSSANLTDETNSYIKRETQNVLNQVIAHKMYLCKLLSISLDPDEYKENIKPLIVFNTLPYKRKVFIETKVLTKNKQFKLDRFGKEIKYTLLSCEKKNGGVLRKNPELIDASKYFYESLIQMEIEDMNGLSYETIKIFDGESPSNIGWQNQTSHGIENNRYKLYHDENGIHIFDKAINKLHRKAIYLEDSGDEGDSFDYSYPTNDMILKDWFEDSIITYYESSIESKMNIKGEMKVPKDLVSRKKGYFDSVLEYDIDCILSDKSYIEIKGTINNNAKAHRVRLVFTTDEKHDESYAGTQFGYIKRDTYPKALDYWKEDNWFEEPSAQWPLLNHVSAVGDSVTSVFTRSSKEYEMIGEQYENLAIVLFRAYGAMAYPDLNRRPGRPSGLDYRIFETPSCQMIGENKFELALEYNNHFNCNELCNHYIEYASGTICYEGQNFDKSEHLIQYFPTNPCDQIMPDKYSLLNVDFEGSFGTIVKSDIDDSYILRLYNNDEKKIPAYQLDSSTIKEVSRVNLLEEEKEINDIGCKSGELINIKLKKEG